MVIKSQRHAVSVALRDLPKLTQLTLAADVDAPLPLPHFRDLNPNNPVRNGAVQGSRPQPQPLLASQLLNFDGIPVNGGGGGFVAPPDTNGAVGLYQFVQIVNLAFAVYNTSDGSLASGPSVTNSLWSGFGGDCEMRNDGDPVVLYDKLADRWLITQFTVRPFRTGSGTFLQCMAVSTSGDATGTYNLYAFDFGPDDLIDYGKFSVWTDAYYGNMNTFNRTGTAYKYSTECAFDRIAMQNGDPGAQAVCFHAPGNGGFLSADLDGFNPPPDGSPNPFVELFTSTSLAIWPFHVDFGTPGNSTFGPPVFVPVAAFSVPPGTTVPQAGTAQRLDTLGDRMMFRLAYRNFGDHESIVATHSVGTSGQVSVRWYEIQDPNGTPFVNQQGTFAPDAGFRWMGSIAMDQVGNIAIGYSESSPTETPSVRFTGRLNTDPPGTLEDEAIIFTGPASQTSGLNRWGDYSAITLDPNDDCTFWYTTEYIPFAGAFNWNTRIGSFVMPNCPGGQ
jgi:hypothetical protein